MNQPDPDATARTRARYQRIAPIYDIMEILPEQQYIPWRKRLWSRVEGPKILEVGVGTGKNMPFYPEDVEVIAIDLTPGMVQRARKRAEKLDPEVEVEVSDVQDLEFPDNTFDTAIATFVFCSVPDPVLGMWELNRVVKPGGLILLIEHMRADNPLLGSIMDALNPVFVRLTGANINRRTVQNVRKAGLKLEEVEELGWNGIFKLIVARADRHG